MIKITRDRDSALKAFDISKEERDKFEIEISEKMDEITKRDLETIISEIKKKEDESAGKKYIDYLEIELQSEPIIDFMSTLTEKEKNYLLYSLLDNTVHDTATEMFKSVGLGVRKEISKEDGKKT